MAADGSGRGILAEVVDESSLGYAGGKSPLVYKREYVVGASRGSSSSSCASSSNHRSISTSLIDDG